MHGVVDRVTTDPYVVLCDDHVPDGRVMLRGAVVKGPPHLSVCRECGSLVEGVPSLADTVYKRVTGEWPWADAVDGRDTHDC